MTKQHINGNVEIIEHPDCLFIYTQTPVLREQNPSIKIGHGDAATLSDMLNAIRDGSAQPVTLGPDAPKGATHTPTRHDGEGDGDPLDSSKAETLRFVAINGAGLAFSSMNAPGPGDVICYFDRPATEGFEAITLAISGDIRVALQAALGAQNLYFAGKAIAAGEVDATAEAVRAAPTTANMYFDRAQLSELLHAVRSPRESFTTRERTEAAIVEAIAALDKFDPPKVEAPVKSPWTGSINPKDDGDQPTGYGPGGERAVPNSDD